MKSFKDLINQTQIYKLYLKFFQIKFSSWNIWACNSMGKRISPPFTPIVRRITHFFILLLCIKINQWNKANLEKVQRLLEPIMLCTKKGSNWIIKAMHTLNCMINRGEKHSPPLFLPTIPSWLKNFILKWKGFQLYCSTSVRGLRILLIFLKKNYHMCI